MLERNKGYDSYKRGKLDIYIYRFDDEGIDVLVEAETNKYYSAKKMLHDS